MHIRTGSLIALMVIVACGDDDAPASPETPRNAGDDSSTAGTAAPTPGKPDAAPTEDDGGMTPDAATGGPGDGAMPQEGPDCEAGKIACDGECVAEIAPTLSAVHARIVERGCALSASCHTGVRPKEGLDLTTPESMIEFVGRASAQQPSLSIIEAGDPDQSYLIHKLRGEDIAASSSTGAAATRMPPPPTDALCEGKIRALEAWIAAGARDD